MCAPRKGETINVFNKRVIKKKRKKFDKQNFLKTNDKLNCNTLKKLIYYFVVRPTLETKEKENYGMLKGSIEYSLTCKKCHEAFEKHKKQDTMRVFQIFIFIIP